MHRVEFKQVSKRQGGARVLLDAIDLTIQDGEIFALIGENGAGKTTLLKALLDLVGIDNGEIKLDAQPHNQALARKGLAYLPEQFRPPHFLSGEQFIRAIARLTGVEVSHAEIVSVSQSLALDIDALKQKPRRYSKGMRQKLGLVSVLLCGKKMLVLDEPMSGLDTYARVLLKTQLRALRDQGRSILLSTHLLNDAEGFCDRLGVLSGGKLRFVGSPAEFRRAYAAENLEAAYLACVSSDVLAS